MFKTQQKGTVSRVSMSVTKSRLRAIIGFLLMTVGVIAQAQDEPSLIGKWEQVSDMVHIEIKPEDDAENGVLSAPVRYYAVITRADWNPGRVGRRVYQNLTYSGKNRWSGVEESDSGKTRKIRLTMRKDGYLHTTSYLDGRKKIRWTPLPSESP